MPTADYYVPELKRSYQVLDVPLSASAPSIKHAYRRITKRWHPDLYPSGSAQQSEATQMMKLINEAYGKIQHAPLRYYVEPNSMSWRGRMPSPAHTRPYQANTIDTETFPRTDRLEFWVRFVCGALFGAFLSFKVVLDFSPDIVYPRLLILGALCLVLTCGFGAARFGDKFWYSILRHWWLWP